MIELTDSHAHVDGSKRARAERGERLKVTLEVSGKAGHR